MQITKFFTSAYGNLTVRSLLDMREHCLNEFDFPDPYLQQKKVNDDFVYYFLSIRTFILFIFNSRNEGWHVICD